MKIDIDAKTLMVASGGLGAIAALLLGAPTALADPVVPVPPPPPPVAAPAFPWLPPPPPPAEMVDAAAPAVPAAAPLPGDVAPLPPADPAAAPLAGDVAPPAERPHLLTPENLPPGYTTDPAAKGTESANVSYLKDLWHAVQNQEISGKEALLMGLAQRGMDTPYPEQAAGPNVPLSPVDPAAGPNVPLAPIDPAAAPPPPAPQPPPPPAPPWLPPPPAPLP